jgi:uncharacterized protein YdeI (YjbR/CyaY-like superfamily)
MSGLSGYEKREFRSRAQLRKWLLANHESATTFWLVAFKKHVADACIPYGEIVEELLCVGWIDSRTRRLDDDRTMLLVTPRNPGSTWSASNKKRVARLERTGLMTGAGRRAIETAKKDGSWTFLDDVEKLVVPEDLATALAKNKRAQKNYDAFAASSRKIVLLWIKTAKREATRKQRIRETVRLAAKNVRAAHPEAQGK